MERVRAVVRAAEDNDEACRGRLDALTHYTCPTLAHLTALLCRPSALCIPQSASLVVVDSLSALLNHDLPKAPAKKGESAPPPILLLNHPG